MWVEESASDGKTSGLTAKAVEHQKKPGRYADGGGLYLQVTPAKSRSWIFRYLEPVIRPGKSKRMVREMGLGRVNDLALADAREACRLLRADLKAGIDPLETGERRRPAQSQGVETESVVGAPPVMTFKACAEAYIEAKQAEWKNAKHRQQWRATLEAYAYPVFGSRAVAEIDTAVVLDVLRPIWSDKPETASRVRNRIERILAWSTISGYRTGDNPARWASHLQEVLASPKKVKKPQHHPAMPYTDVPGFMGELRSNPYISARALEVTILTALRTGEVIGAKWPEIDLDKGLWTVPAERMKAGKAHEVPLTARVIEILNDLPREAEFIFPGAKAGKPLSNMSMLNLLQGRYPDFTVHGFRSAFRDWAAEETNHDRDVVEMALAHTIGNRVEAAYRRRSMLAKRGALMRDWASFCAGEMVLSAGQKEAA